MKKILGLFLAIIFVQLCSFGGTEKAYEMSAMHALMSGNYERALVYANKGLAENSQNYVLMTLRGTIKQAQDDFAGAFEDYDEALKIAPDYYTAIYNRGSLNLNLGKPKEAMVDLNQAIEVNPSNAAYNSRGLAKSLLGDYQGAIVDFNEAVLLDPNDENAYYNRGVANINLENYKLAIPDLTKAIETQSTNPDAFYYRGLANVALGNKRQGIKDLKQAKSQYEDIDDTKNIEETDSILQELKKRK